MAIQDTLSMCFLAGLPLLGVFPLWRLVNIQTEYSWLERVLYAPVYCVGRLLWRVEIIGEDKICKALAGGAIIVANHRCSLDPFFLQLAAGRRIHWMVAGEYFKNPVFGPVLRLFQAIPTNRSGADNASVKRAMRLASEGRLVGMFPEGRINRTPRPLLSIRTGAAMVAEKCQVPLLPCWIEGAPIGWAVWSGLFMAAHVRIYVGKVVPVVKDGSNAVDITDQAMIQAMSQALRLGGYPTATVELARRRIRAATIPDSVDTAVVQ